MRSRRTRSAGRSTAASAPCSCACSRSSRRSVRPFEEVAAELKRDLATERAKAEILPIYDKIEDERSLGRLLPEAAANLKLAVRTIEVDRHGLDRSGKPVDRSAGRATPADSRRSRPISASRTIRCSSKAATSGTKSPTSRPSATGRSTRSRIRSKRAGARRRSRTRLRAKATEMLRTAQAQPACAELAAAEGLKVETRAEIKRGSATRSDLAARARCDLPHPQGRLRQPRKPKARPSSWCSASPTSRCRKPIANSEEAKKLRDALNQSYAQDVFGEYLMQLQRQIGVTINENALKQVVTGQRSDLN